MPRDLTLESAKAALDDMAPLAKDEAPHESADDVNDVTSSPEYYEPMSLYRLPTAMMEERFRALKELHPYVQLLSQDDLDDCDWLEHTAFDAIEAATREKLDYRLHVSGDLGSAIFSSAHVECPKVANHSCPEKVRELLGVRDFPRVDNGTDDTDRRRVLLGHIVATKHAADRVTDAAMDYPKDWRTNYELVPASGTGHNHDGRTVCLHSLCVHPKFQKMGLGRVLLLSWVQRLRGSGVADRVALICRDRYINFYESVGFQNMGESKCQYGGGGWYDMILDFDDGMESE